MLGVNRLAYYTPEDPPAYQVGFVKRVIGPWNAESRKRIARIMRYARAHKPRKEDSEESDIKEDINISEESDSEL